ncbi:MAG: IPT/TIG domain-containing protein [Cytophagales bacterium]|nr:IPT/TIG domain-containing protein [Cytophagales bacterium]
MSRISILMGLAALLGIVSLRGQTTPVITDFTPKTGPPGTEVTVRGRGFRNPASDNYILFNSVPQISAHEVNAAGTELKFYVPASWSGRSAGPITIEYHYSSALRPRGLSTSGFTPIPLSITDFTPKTGLPGTVITITGTGFDVRRWYNHIHLTSASWTLIDSEVNSLGTLLRFRVPASWPVGSVGPITVNFDLSSSEKPRVSSKADFSLISQGTGINRFSGPELDELDTRYLRKTDAYAKTESDERYARKTDLDDLDTRYFAKTDLDDLDARYLKRTDYVSETDLAEIYIKKTDLEDLDIIRSMREELVGLLDELAALKRQIGVGGSSRTFGSSVRLEQNILIRPNPASDYLEIRTPEDTYLKIIDATGKVLRAVRIPRGLNRISIQDLPSGGYLLLLQIGTQATSYNFIKR